MGTGLTLDMVKLHTVPEKVKKEHKVGKLRQLVRQLLISVNFKVVVEILPPLDVDGIEKLQFDANWN